MAVKAARQHPAHDPDSADRALVLERFLPYQLSLLSNHVSQAIADLYAARFGIGITEWRVIAVLGRFSGISASDVAERTAMDKVAVSRALARLLDRALITRKLHADDRRRSVLALTREGRRIHAGIAPLALELERKLLVVLDGGERAQLARLLDKLSAGIAEVTAG